jgi:hypothetical protein
MNNRIKELANQCRIEYRDGHGGFIEQFDEERFAELIIAECAKVSEDDITDGDACCTNTAYRIASQIKEHFGVEE